MDSVVKAKNENERAIESLPLKQRLKLLLANQRLLASSGTSQVLESSFDASIQKEDEQCDSQNLQSAFSVQQEMLGSSTLQNNVTVTAEKVDDTSSGDMETINSKKPDDTLDDLDFVVLRERQRKLQSRKEPCSKRLILEDKPSNFSNVLMEDPISRSAGMLKGQLHPQVSKQGESSHGLNLSSFNRKRKIGFPLSDRVHIKVEPVDKSTVETTRKNVASTMPHGRAVPVKSEPRYVFSSFEDALDHMVLRDRINLFSSGRVPSIEINRVAQCSNKLVSSIPDCTPISSMPAKPIRGRPRKGRKTATDSVEVAMEEDAPGLLQVLREKGISADEIKLYGENESNKPLDDSSSEDGFSELEAVISKLFSQRQPLLKLAPLQCTKVEKASYCLTCLFSLIEQARYLHFRKWPVEWGWCRDLQSFIFVFERHNRIVLERPEYGYATYFFELVDSSPINWQIRRLVTAMKLTNCSRVTLIENRTLTIGEELSEGEARVLMAYGWIPNTGFGTLLNYCDRVVHDRKTEKDRSEWRSKIGKLLIDGYNGGSIVEKLAEYDVPQSCPEIKLELD